MTEKFIIQGQNKLEGEVLISGSKNAAASILPAALLTQESCIINNLPLVEDIFKIIKLLESIGAKVEWLEKRKIKITAGKNLLKENLDLSLLGETRMSVLLIGPLLSRFKQFKFMPPGGDKILGNVRSGEGKRMGLRPITTHLEAFEKLGIEIKRQDNIYIFNSENLKPTSLILKEFSVTATENLMMLAAATPGNTIIKGAAIEPHIQSLAQMLNKMGAQVKILNNHIIEINGTKNLKGVEYNIIPDYLEAGTFMIAGAVTPGVLKIKNFPFNDLDLFLAKLEEMGVKFKVENDSMEVDFSPNLKSVRIQALPYPGFPTDLLPVVIPLLTQAQGRSLIHDPLYENRLNFLSELRKMNADIEIVDPHRAFIFGKTLLFSTDISSWDIRAGACLLIAGLIAKGETKINNIYQIDRGYEKIDEKLRAVGAKIKRVAS
ncbi:MAG: UDP-N-acetylglucosamine 1-carboxyvinyltransferase [Candidatus Pacebacteria bacterium]|nr:UDP-N-acetylglucosamine 1-carboxyvinyltransferase [Candidatus Paceibacterota bacterium]